MLFGLLIFAQILSTPLSYHHVFKPYNLIFSRVVKNDIVTVIPPQELTILQICVRSFAFIEGSTCYSLIWTGLLTKSSSCLSSIAIGASTYASSQLSGISIGALTEVSICFSQKSPVELIICCFSSSQFFYSVLSKDSFSSYENSSGALKMGSTRSY